MRPTVLLAAAALFTGCFGRHQTHPRALENNELCARYIDANDLVKAEVHCDHGLEFSADYADLWVNKGLIALRREQRDLAKEHFIKALRFNNEHHSAYNNLGYIYLKEQQYGKAHDNFRRALRVNPDYVEARYNLAIALKAMKKNQQAAKELRHIIAVNPNLADPHHNLGLLALEAGSAEESIEYFRRATQLDPQFADAWLHLGIAYSETGKYQEAKEAFTSCLDADANNAQCRNNVTIVNRKSALLDPALRDLKEQQQTDRSPQSFYALAQTYRDRGLKNEEERWYRKCIKLDGKYAPCHYGLFRLFEEERKDRDAQVACKNFLKFAVAEEFPEEVERCEKFVKSF
jgi:tetratricopeptide (TPR) repeat protein